MYEQEIVTYVRSIEPLLRGRFKTDRNIVCREIGDGNLNLVFLLSDYEGSKICVKKSLPYVRMIGSEWPLDADRIIHERVSLEIFSMISPGTVPKVYDGDSELHVITMEALVPGATVRSCVVAGVECPGIGKAVGDFVGRVARTCKPSDIQVLGYDSDRPLFRNDNMTDVTRLLVFEEPFLEDVHRNHFPQELSKSVRYYRSNPAVIAAALTARNVFEERKEALIHGDLHTGSIMKMNSGEYIIFDTEFSRFGPVMFDLGVFVANLIFAAIRSLQMNDVDACLSWLQEIEDSWKYFVSASQLFKIDFENHEYREREYLRSLGEFCVIELGRRVIGLAKVPELENFHSRQGVQVGSYALRCAELIASSAQELNVSISTYIDDIKEVLGLRRLKHIWRP